MEGAGNLPYATLNFTKAGERSRYAGIITNQNYVSRACQTSRSLRTTWSNIEYNYLPTQYANYRETPDEVIYRHLAARLVSRWSRLRFAASLPPWKQCAHKFASHTDSVSRRKKSPGCKFVRNTRNASSPLFSRERERSVTCRDCN